MQESASPACASVAPGLMRAHVLVRPGDIRLEEIPRPVAEPGELVIRVRAALTCGTDVKAFVRGHPKFPMPTPFGHEFAGEVADVGAGVRGFRVGDAIMAVPTAPCGECYYCAHQQENLCDTVMDTMVLGAYAEYVRLPPRLVRVNVYPKPGSLPFPVAALLEPLACVFHGLEKVPLRPDDTIVLLGAGAISLLHLLVLRGLGVRDVIVVGRRPSRAEHARGLGAARVLLGDIGTVRQEVLELTHGRGADVVIECTGQLEVWEAAPGFARRGGHVILFGGCPPGAQMMLDTQRLHYDQLHVLSPFHFTPRSVRRAYDALASGTVDGSGLITASYGLEALRRALDEHRLGKGIKFAVIP
jgi:L-iditol 2-dehydrogenase